MKFLILADPAPVPQPWISYLVLFNLEDVAKLAKGEGGVGTELELGVVVGRGLLQRAVPEKLVIKYVLKNDRHSQITQIRMIHETYYRNTL